MKRRRAPRPWALLAGLLLAVTAAAAQPGPVASASAPRTGAGIAFRSDGDLGAGLGRAVAGVVVVLGVGLGAVWLLRHRLRATAFGAARRLRVVERLQVTPRTTLLLVEFDGRTVLLGDHGAALVVIARAPAAPAAPRPTAGVGAEGTA